MANSTCNGDVFDRWGGVWGRSLWDSTIFEIKVDVETCPNCNRPWRGERGHRGFNPDLEPTVIVRDREWLREQLATALSRAERAETALGEERKHGGRLAEILECLLTEEKCAAVSRLTAEKERGVGK